MRILLASDTYPPDVNGASRFTERLALGLTGRGHEVHVAAPSAEGPGLTESLDGVTVHRVVSYRWPLHEWYRVCLPWTAKPACRRIVEKVRPDVVHVQAHFIVGRYTTIAAHDLGYPLIATNHFMPENLFMHARTPQWFEETARKAAWWDLQNVFGRAQHITAPTPRAVELLEQRTRLTGEALSNGIDPTRYEAAAGRASHDPAHPVILFVGRLDQEKRVDELLRAFAALPEELRGPDGARVEIIGDGSCRDEWKRLVGELGVDDRVRFRGYVSEDELVEAYGRCDIFCMPGIAELQSLVTLEAMSAGKPVVAADAMALPHLVHPGENGMLYTPGNITQLRDHLASLISDPAMRERYGRASRAIVARHSFAKTLDRFEELYGEAIGQEAPSPVEAAGQA
ncbi:MAG TPA: glycosyltransferase [Candidatus Avipropionibacterium avicola]|uniref:Glycosyltransferase n=1 Tax=Candidatus Avipropionibacterium avicola TaxID=2840701 RepID=A0A9D1GZT4_9ACTN|nr:glycosyltransferase [Candidatus Avipropionibacterium avicola]